MANFQKPSRMHLFVGFGSLLVGLSACFWGLVFLVVPRRYADVKMSCAYNDANERVPTLPGLPFTCGWHELRPGSEVRSFVFIQPDGSWCLSNAGYVQGSKNGTGLLVDTLMDPVLTEGMLNTIPTRLPGQNHPVSALVYTHPDIDHYAGDQNLPRSVPRIGNPILNYELLTAFPKQRTVLELAISVGHYMWGLINLVGWKPIVHNLPSNLKRTAFTVFGWAYMQANLAKFSLHKIRSDLHVGITDPINDGESRDLKVDGLDLPIRFNQFGPIHSKSDSVIILPSERIVFAGDLLFIGIAPVLWAGTAKDWIGALDTLLSQTGPDWIYVPGHGPPTDQAGVRKLRSYLEYLDSAVTALCPEAANAPKDWTAGKKVEEGQQCAQRVFEGLPENLKTSFAQPERIIISSQIELNSRNNGGKTVVDIKMKVRLLSSVGAQILIDSL